MASFLFLANLLANLLAKPFFFFFKRPSIRHCGVAGDYAQMLVLSVLPAVVAMPFFYGL
ncbi:hypothetical protein LX36DRAFT_651455 [Colletotrichum falcatum]|nr:hypothetical protein LX36DRAFT_651455 [Colletotrichum falcatum]